MKKYIFFCLVPVYSFCNIYSQTATLDNTFGSGGLVITNINDRNDGEADLKVQPDGKILQLGYSYDSLTFKMILIRYNIDGSIDTTFGNQGFVDGYIIDSTMSANSLVLQNDGKILVTGAAKFNTTYQAAIMRFNADGSPDNSFDSDGIKIFPAGLANSEFLFLLIQPDDKIVAVGDADDSLGTYQDYAIARFHPDGMLDSTFGINGMVKTMISAYSDIPHDAILQNDGKIVTVSYNINFIVVRYNNDGTLDNSFGVNGIADLAVGFYNCFAYDLEIKSNGQILVCGTIDDPFTSSTDVGIVQCNTDGSVDPGFGSAGLVTTDVAGSLFNDGGMDLSILGDGKLLVGGYSSYGTYKDFVLIRYTADGWLDNSFNAGDGMVVTEILGYDDYCRSVEIQADGKVLMGGSSYNGSNYDMSMIRFTSDLLSTDPSILADQTNLYPNPATREITIEAPYKVEKVEIFNLQGQLVSIKNPDQNNQIDISEISNGHYLTRIYLEHTNEIQIKKLIINR